MTANQREESSLMNTTQPVEIDDLTHDNVYRLTLRTLVYPAHDQVVAYALDTDLMGAGSDEDEAIATLRQTIKVFLEDAAMRGTPEDLMKRKAHSSFFDRWKQPPIGVDAGYLSMTVRLRQYDRVAIAPPRALKCA